LADALRQSRPNDQVLTLDWSAAAGTFILAPGSAAEGIVPTATWAAKALQGAGIMGHQLNLVGHSFGAYVADEIAKRYPGNVNSIAALDPAANAAPDSYDPVSNDNVNFSRNSRWSWAFHSSDLGNEIVPTRASEAFRLSTDFLLPWNAHSGVVGFFAYAIMNPNDPICSLFGLPSLLDNQYGPWVLDQYQSNPFATTEPRLYEAIIRSSESNSPLSITFITNAPVSVIESPASGSFVSGSPILLRGTSTDFGRGSNGIASVDVNGLQVYRGPSANGQTVSWTATVPVFLGTNWVEVVATDTSTPNVGRGTNFHSLIFLPPFLDMPNVHVRIGASIFSNLAAGDSQLSARPLAYLLETGPVGLTVTSAGLLTWIPSLGQPVATNTVIVRVTDGTVTTRKRMTAILEPRNAGPVISPVPTQYLATGETLELNINATDPDIPAQTLKYTLIQGPPGLTIGPAGRVTWKPPQSPTSIRRFVTFTVTDGIAIVNGRFDIVLLALPNPSQPPQLRVSAVSIGDALELHVRGPSGSVLGVEGAENLNNWSEELRIPADGMDKVVRIPLDPAGQGPQRFWRVRNLGQQ
jgi:pimeloyl-ACP methyl ester carboxylesterase